MAAVAADGSPSPTTGRELVDALRAHTDLIGHVAALSVARTGLASAPRSVRKGIPAAAATEVQLLAAATDSALRRPELLDAFAAVLDGVQRGIRAAGPHAPPTPEDIEAFAEEWPSPYLAGVHRHLIAHRDHLSRDSRAAIDRLLIALNRAPVAGEPLDVTDVGLKLATELRPSAEEPLSVTPGVACFGETPSWMKGRDGPFGHLVRKVERLKEEFGPLTGLVQMNIRVPVSELDASAVGLTSGGHAALADCHVGCRRPGDVPTLLAPAGRIDGARPECLNLTAWLVMETNGLEGGGRVLTPRRDPVFRIGTAFFSDGSRKGPVGAGFNLFASLRGWRASPKNTREVRHLLLGGIAVGIRDLLAELEGGLAFALES